MCPRLCDGLKLIRESMCGCYSPRQPRREYLTPMSPPAPTAQHAHRRPSWRTWGLLGLAMALFALAWFGAEPMTLPALRAHQQALVQWQAEHPWQARGAYAAVYLIFTGLSLPSAAVLTLAGGAIFGLQVGLLLVLLSATAGATVSMLMARYLLTDL